MENTAFEIQNLQSDFNSRLKWEKSKFEDRSINVSKLKKPKRLEKNEDFQWAMKVPRKGLTYVYL